MRHSSLVVYVALVAAIAASCRRRAAPPEPRAPHDEAWLTPAQAQRMRLTVVAQHEVGSILKTSGRVTFDDMRVAHVFSPVAGRIVRILAHPGDRVVRGGPLVVIASPDVGNAFSDLAKARADLAAAQHELRRQRELYAARATARRDLETARDTFARAQAEMQRALEKARLLSRGPVDRVRQELTLTSPIDGEVIAHSVHPGQDIQGQYSGGAALELFTVGELDLVWVLGDVYEMDLGRVSVGTPAQVRVAAYPDRVYDGRVEWMSDALDPATRTAKIRVNLANPDRALKPEMYATVSLTVEARQALAVPRQALLRSGEQLVVFVERGRAPDGRLAFQRRPVRVSTENDGLYVQVLDGLRAGERVVISGGIELLGMTS